MLEGGGESPTSALHVRSYDHRALADMNGLATLHLADLYRDPRMRIPVQLDWGKIPRFLAGTWPVPVPPREIVTAEAPEALDLLRLCEWGTVVIDTEYHPDTRYLLLLGIGFLTPHGVEGIQIPWPRLPFSLKTLAAQSLKDLVGRCRVVFQNLQADVPVLEQNLGILPSDYYMIEDLMLAHAVLWSEWPHDLEFLASLYGVHPKMKHLSGSDPLLYNWGDVLDTASAWSTVERELQADPRSAAIYRTQSLPITLRGLLPARSWGIRIVPERVAARGVEYLGKQDEALRMARAWVGWPLNLGSSPQISRYLYGMQGLPRQYHTKTHKVTIDADAVAMLRGHLGPAPDFEEEERNGLTSGSALARCAEGADPVLEARVIYAHARQAQSHYIAPAQAALEGAGRFYPSFHLHAQASGRWSTVEPPLAQLPKDLHDIVGPDPGTVWLGWDWDQIELRLNAALAQDLPTLEAFVKGWDVHTLTCCDCFGYPYPPDLQDPHTSPAGDAWRRAHAWQGKDDTRRVFAKRFVYRLAYGGDPGRAGDIPGARTLGLTPRHLVQAAQRYLAAHPAQAAWKHRITLDARAARESRTFTGRLRKLLGHGNALVREAFNHPMQGGVADIFNITFLRVLDAFPYLQWMYGAHDSQWWQCPEDRVDETRLGLREIVEREWNVGGVPVRFPATWKERVA